MLTVDLQELSLCLSVVPKFLVAIRVILLKIEPFPLEGLLCAYPSLQHGYLLLARRSLGKHVYQFLQLSIQLFCFYEHSVFHLFQFCRANSSEGVCKEDLISSGSTNPVTSTGKPLSSQVTESRDKFTSSAKKLSYTKVTGSARNMTSIQATSVTGTPPPSPGTKWNDNPKGPSTTETIFSMQKNNTTGVRENIKNLKPKSEEKQQVSKNSHGKNNLKNQPIIYILNVNNNFNVKNYVTNSVHFDNSVNNSGNHSYQTVYKYITMIVPLGTIAVIVLVFIIQKKNILCCKRHKKNFDEVPLDEVVAEKSGKDVKTEGKYNLLLFFNSHLHIVLFRHLFVLGSGISGFSLGRLHMGGQVLGDKALMGQTHEGGHRPYGGPNFDRSYHKLKVLLLLS